MLQLRVRGLAKVRDNLTRFQRRYAAALEAGVFLAAQRVMNRVLPGVPVDTSELVESRAVTRTWPVKVMFGSDHAVFSHARSRKRRWLQVPFSRMSPQLAAWVARFTTRAFREELTLASAPADHPETPQESSGRRPSKRKKRPQRAPRRRS